MTMTSLANYTNIDKIRKFPGHAMNFTKYINDNNAQILLNKISLNQI